MQSEAADPYLHHGVFSRYVPVKVFVLALWVAGCGGNSSTTKTVTSQPSPQNYFAPVVTGATAPVGTTLGVPQIYTIDDTGTSQTPPSFSQSTYALNPPQQQGVQVLNAGSLVVGQRGLRQLSITASYIPVSSGGSNGYELAPPPAAPQTGFALELGGQTGGLLQLSSQQPPQPLVAAVACPGSTTQSYLFVTIPSALVSPAQSASGQAGFNPISDTAYGTVNVSVLKSDPAFEPTFNVNQFLLSGAHAASSSAQTNSSTYTGTCGPTVYGNITNVPGQAIVGTGNQPVTAQAKVGIGPTGLFVEDNAQGAVNILGAGTGAVGLPMPQSPVSTTAAIGTQYLGFIYGAGSVSAPGFSSNLASFGGSSNIPVSCTSLHSSAMMPDPMTSIYGGDFDPSSSTTAFGNCDFAVDLGSQDATTNGLYTGATVYIGPNYPGNTTGTMNSFNAVAIAGQFSDGRYAIFVIGVDASQPWAIYLLQSS